MFEKLSYLFKTPLFSNPYYFRGTNDKMRDAKKPRLLRTLPGHLFIIMTAPMYVFFISKYIYH